MTHPSSPTPTPAYKRITPDCQPVFPCWVWHSGNHLMRPEWTHSSQLVQSLAVSPYTTHWHPDQSIAPTCVPGEEERQRQDKRQGGLLATPRSTPSAQEAAERAAEELAVYAWTSGTKTVEDFATIILRHFQAVPAQSPESGEVREASKQLRLNELFFIASQRFFTDSEHDELFALSREGYRRTERPTLPMTSPNKKPPVKARELYSYPHEDYYVVTDAPPMARDVKTGWCNPVFVLPASREAYEQMVEQGARGLYEASRKTVKAALHPKRRKAFHSMGGTTKDEQRKWYRALSVSILAAIGITPPTK